MLPRRVELGKSFGCAKRMHGENVLREKYWAEVEDGLVVTPGGRRDRQNARGRLVQLNALLLGELAERTKVRLFFAFS